MSASTPGNCVAATRLVLQAGNRVTRLALLPFVVWIALLGSARAEPIVIQGGGLGFSFDSPPGFSLQGEGLSVSSFFPSIGITSAFVCGFPSSCPPGSVIDLSSVFGGPPSFGLGVGGATIGGVTYGTHTPGAEAPIEFRGTFLFDAPTLLVPETPEGRVLLTGLFTFQGSLAGYEWQEFGPPLFEVQLFGRGRVAMLLGGAPSGLGPPGPYQFLDLRYTFDPAEPIPEPATMLLLGTGLAGVLVRRRLFRRGSAAGAEPALSPSGQRL